MSVPPELIGAWRRTGLIIGGRRQIDFCDVLWIQGATWFADIRLPVSDLGPDTDDPIATHFGRLRAFAGRASWIDPILHWDHEIDIDLTEVVDANKISWERGGIVERGTRQRGGADVPWEEEWVRVSAPDAPVEAQSIGPKHLIVSVGPWQIEVTDERPGRPFKAVRRDLIDSVWQVVGEVIA